jgi:DNA-binding response OmpR family regulator
MLSDLWGLDPDPTARATLDNHMARLRRKIERDPRAAALPSSPCIGWLTASEGGTTS